MQPKVIAARGVYEATYLVAGGHVMLYAVDSHGQRVATEIVNTPEQYDNAMTRLQQKLEQDDPTTASPLTLVR